MTYYAVDPSYSFIYTVLLAFLVVLAFALLMPTRTKRYRKEITDMFVAGRIRQLAEEHKIDLEEEYRVFKQYHRRHRMENQPLDNTVEESLQEEIVEGNIKKLNPKK